METIDQNKVEGPDMKNYLADRISDSVKGMDQQKERGYKAGLNKAYNLMSKHTRKDVLLIMTLNTARKIGREPEGFNEGYAESQKVLAGFFEQKFGTYDVMDGIEKFFEPKAHRIQTRLFSEKHYNTHP
jgi:hypothetical protein